MRSNRYARGVTVRPLLLLDCAVEPYGSLDEFGRFLGNGPLKILRAAHEDLPDHLGDVSGIVITGSAASVYERQPWSEACVHLLRDAIDRDIPTLGVCYGHQLLGEAAGGQNSVIRMPAPEVGFRSVHMRRGDPLFDALPEHFVTYQTHGDGVVMREGFEVWASNAHWPVQAIRVPGKRAWGVQFHTEFRPETQLELMQRRMVKHPGLRLNPAAEMESRPDTEAQGRTLFGRFLELTQ